MTNLSAQVFVGADNFNSGTLLVQGSTGSVNQASNQWRINTATGNSTFSETGGQLQYTNSTPTGTNSDVLYWVTPSYSYNTTASAPNPNISQKGIAYFVTLW